MCAYLTSSGSLTVSHFHPRASTTLLVSVNRYVRQTFFLAAVFARLVARSQH